VELLHLRTLAKRYPDVEAALTELANLEAVLTLPMPTVHIVSDVHGEHDKLRQVIANASGSLRPLVEGLLGVEAAAELLPVLYRPRDAYPPRRAQLAQIVANCAKVMRVLARRYTLKHVERVIPDPFDALFRELLFRDETGRSVAFFEQMLAPFVRHGRDLELVRTMAHAIRDLAVGELVVAGDLGDRGPRIDKVIDSLMQQPNVAITWGNHDGDWMAASLGHPAAIATVVRLSLRYQRLAQLEEGYGISMEPVAELARAAYGEDPVARFAVKGSADLRLARMQKAAAILQFKLEGALFRRRADWEMEERALLHRIDPGAGTITLEGTSYPLLDAHFPTIDWNDPYALSADEQRCLDALTASFTGSYPLARHMRFVASRGKMWLRRDQCAIFHGCVPVDEAGEPIALVLDGAPQKGRAMLDAFERVVQRAFLHAAPEDVDWLFYLWTGPRSPCFGKDRMATFETYFLDDKETQHEHKNPYFELLADPAFCGRVLKEFGVDPERGYIVNGHVPVKLDAGEQPLKASGRAITIDGAFAAAYGDKGFSLVLDAERMYLAQHHHLAPGADIVPTVADIERHAPPRTVGDTEIGEDIRGEIAALEELVSAFEQNLIRSTR
jgi:fructose-1,6-bisphosphatase-3